MVFKKDLTPIGRKGTVDKQAGKGSSNYRPSLMGRVTNRYPKPAPAPTAPPRGLTPPFGIGPPAEEA